MSVYYNIYTDYYRDYTNRATSAKKTGNFMFLCNNFQIWSLIPHIPHSNDPSFSGNSLLTIIVNDETPTILENIWARITN